MKDRANGSTTTNKQNDERDIERMVETQSKGEQPDGIPTEQAKNRNGELDTRESKGGFKP